MAKKKKGKRKLPTALKYTRECAKEIGIKPFKKWTAEQKRKVAKCAEKKLARSKK